jgi:hypothetical protein
VYFNYLVLGGILLYAAVAVAKELAQDEANRREKEVTYPQYRYVQQPEIVYQEPANREVARRYASQIARPYVPPTAVIAERAEEAKARIERSYQLAEITLAQSVKMSELVRHAVEVDPDNAEYYLHLQRAINHTAKSVIIHDYMVGE